MKPTNEEVHGNLTKKKMRELMNQGSKKMTTDKRTVLICRGTGCESTQSPAIQAALDAELRDSDVEVRFTGCHGMCQQGPIVIVEPEGTFITACVSRDRS